jgi:hypothetical protein
MLAEIERQQSPTTTGSPPTSERGRRRWIEVVVGAGLLLLAVVLPLLRQTRIPSWNTIWGEDGWVYFQQAKDHGFRVLLRGYAGYLQLPPRLLAIGSVLVPIRWVASYFAVAGVLVGAAAAWFVYWATEGWIDSRGVRLAYAGLVALMPALGYENTANTVNTIWILFGVTPWALLAWSESRRAVVLRSIVAFFCATATALTAIFLPLAIGWAIVRRRRPTLVVVAAFLTGLVLQFAVVTHTRDTRPRTTIRQASKLPEAVGIKVFALLLVGERGIRAVWDQRSVLAVVASLVVLVGLALLLPGLDRRRQVVVCTFVGLALLAFLVPVWGRGTNQVALQLPAHSIFGAAQAGRYDPMATRYSVVPILLLAGAAAIALGSRRSARGSSRGSRTRWAPIVFVTWAVVVTLVGFPVTNPRSLGPSWSSALVSHYDSHCTGASPSTKYKVPVPNRPVNPPVVLSCRDRP